jgi:hypothetical protein
MYPAAVFIPVGVIIPALILSFPPKLAFERFTSAKTPYKFCGTAFRQTGYFSRAREVWL